MPGFEIESHTLSTCVERLGDRAVVTRLLELAGPVLEGDIQHRALITFSDQTSDQTSGRSRDGGANGDGAVGHLSQPDGGGMTVVGWLPAEQLDGVMAVLADGAALRYRLAFGAARSGYLDRLRVEPRVARRPTRSGPTSGGPARPDPSPGGDGPEHVEAGRPPGRP